MQNCGMAPFCNLGRKFVHRNGGRGAVFWPKTGLNLGEDLFFWSSPNFRPKTGMNLSENLFFFWSSPKFGQQNEIGFGLENFHSGLH